MSITPIPASMKMEVLALQGWNCLCCGRPVHRYPDSKMYADTLSFDHVLPEKHGGLTTVDNLQVLCMACNLHKGVDTIDLRKEADTWFKHRHLALQEPDLDLRFRKFFSKKATPKVWTLTGWKPHSPWMMDLVDRRWPAGTFDRWDQKELDWPLFKGYTREMPPCPVRERRLDRERQIAQQLRADSKIWLRQQSA